MNAAYNSHSRPEPPLVGPQAQYVLTGCNIGNHRDPVVAFTEGTSHSMMGLEWVLRNLEKFDEPSRHMILAGTAVHFGMSFDVVRGGML